MLALRIDFSAFPGSMAITAEATNRGYGAASNRIASWHLFVTAPQPVPLPHHGLFVAVVTVHCKLIPFPATHCAETGPYSCFLGPGSTASMLAEYGPDGPWRTADHLRDGFHTSSAVVKRQYALTSHRELIDSSSLMH
jgi:hypothetical protein